MNEMPESIKDILRSQMNLTIPTEKQVISEERNSNQKNELVPRYDVNIEKLPFFFFGSEKKKKEMEQKIASSKGGYEMYVQELPDNIRRSLKIDVSMSLGLPTAEDQDVLMAVFYLLNKELFKSGKCPKKLIVQGSELLKIMKKKKFGSVYKRIELSLKRIAGVIIYQNQFIRTKTIDKKLGYLTGQQEKGIKVLFFDQMVKIKNKEKFYNVFEIEFPDWVINDFDNYYTTQLDIDLYFSLPSGRTRRLLRILDVYRYDRPYFLEFNRLDILLSLNEYEERRARNLRIKYALDKLVMSGYLKSFEIQKHGVSVEFAKIKNRYLPSKANNLSDEDKYFVEEIVNEINDEKSRNQIKKIVSEYTNESIYIALSNTRVAINEEGVKKSKGAIFQFMINKYGHKKLPLGK